MGPGESRFTETAAFFPFNNAGKMRRPEFSHPVKNSEVIISLLLYYADYILLINALLIAFENPNS